MINLVTIVMQIAFAFLNMFVKSREKKAKLKEKMFKFSDKHNEILLRNPKFFDEYLEMKRELERLRKQGKE